MDVEAAAMACVKVLSQLACRAPEENETFPR
jgi:hypothetical protein